MPAACAKGWPCVHASAEGGALIPWTIFTAVAAALVLAGAARVKGERLTVVLPGDAGLTMTRAPVTPEGGDKFDRLISADEAMAHVRSLLAGDIFPPISNRR